MPATRFEAKAFYDGLVEARLIVPVGVQGAFGRGFLFEDVLEATNRLISRESSGEGAEVYTFPPVIDRSVLERVDYMDSFPHLAGSIHSYFGKEAKSREIGQRIKNHEAWGDLLGQTGVVMNPAACYPVYPSLAGTLPEEGRLVTMTNWVFRHEPSPEPTRMQSFRVREFVRAASPDEVVAWRDAWLERGLALVLSLGLPGKAEVASDPFFGRGGKVLADGQKAQKLKFEVTVPVISESEPTAICSFNYHQEHFGQVFEIKTSKGEVAHTACLGFGLERVVMALFQTHGFDPKAWPSSVRARLWP